MSVEFHEEETLVAPRPQQKKLSLFNRIVMKLGFAKDEAGAQRVLLVISLLCFGAALLVFINLLWSL